MYLEKLKRLTIWDGESNSKKEPKARKPILLLSVLHLLVSFRSRRSFVLTTIYFDLSMLKLGTKNALKL
jgi:hypothetical protein